MNASTAWRIILRHIDVSRDNPVLESSIDYMTRLIIHLNALEEVNQENEDQLKQALNLRKREEFFGD